MPFPYYTGKAQDEDDNRLDELPVSQLEDLEDPRHYEPDDGLKAAVNAALVLGQPLLLTGEPGTGKTQLAYSIAKELGSTNLGNHRPLKFETKSTSTARDLFYTYDSLSRFHAAQAAAHTAAQADGDILKSKEYIYYNALGIAILRACNIDDLSEFAPRGFKLGHRGRSVVLIDEIDKAPRDFPNDILNEIDAMYFKVPELGNIEFRADKSKRPVVIITSNSEKQLPDAFLRRCVYYHISFPDPKTDRLQKIVMSRIAEFGATDSPMLSEAIEFFYQLRDSNSGLAKKPATAELLGWLVFLKSRGAKIAEPLCKHREALKDSLNIMIKGPEDQSKSEKLLQQWLKKKGQ